MIKKFWFLSTPFALAAAGIILMLALLLPTPASTARDAMALSDQPAAGSEERETTETKEKRTPKRAAAVSDYLASAPPSYANAIVDLTPKMEMEIRLEEARALEDVSFSLPEEKVFPYFVNEEEYKMLCWCVEGEGRGKSVLHREIITQVIFNRVFSDRFPNTIKEVVLSPRQFNAMDWYNPDYFDTFVTDRTFEAVDAVLNMEVDDVSQGALYFCNPNTAASVDWFESRLRRLFDLENHRFYTYP